MFAAVLLLAGLSGCDSGESQSEFHWFACPEQPVTFRLEPPRAIVAVGGSFTYHAPMRAQYYQWQRCVQGAACVDIPGATGSDFTLQGANLADDGIHIEVTSYDCGVRGHASGLLEVLPAPAAVYSDGEFLASDWEAHTLKDASGLVQAHAGRAPAGGLPGAYFEATYDAPAITDAFVVHLSQQATYRPATEGAVHAVDFAADWAPATAACAYPATPLPVLRQSGRWYVPKLESWTSPYRPAAGGWGEAFGRAAYDAGSFDLLDGAPCVAGERCPDFTASGAPITFGFAVQVSKYQGLDSVPRCLGLDNWRVTVWRKPS